MSKRILSVALAMLMLIPFVLGLTSCQKERTEEEIINDIVNSGTIALTLSVWIPTESDTESAEFNERLTAVETAINEILRDKNLSTEIKLTAVSNDEYEEKLDAHLAEIKKKVDAKKGVLPSNVSQSYVNKAIKIPYGDSYMYELAYPDVLETQVDLFMIRSYDEYKSLAQAKNLYSLDSYISKLGGRYADIHKMISPAVLAEYVVGGSTYAIPNNHQYTNAQYQYMLIDKSAFNTVENINIADITDILSCEGFITAIGANSESGYVPFVGSLNDAPGILSFDASNLIGSTIENPAPSSIFDIEAYTKYVELYKKLSDSSYVKKSLDDGEKAAVSFFYGTNEEVKAYEENYYVVKTEKPVANYEDMFSSMFAISKYSANYDRAMKLLYLFQTDSKIITLLQYGIEDVDYSIEINDDGEEYIKVSEDTAYNMSGLNIGNSYHTYKNDGSTIDDWNDVKESNYDLSVNPYLDFANNFNANATDEEKSQLESLVASVTTLASEVNALINSMSCEEYVSFLELLKIDIEAINTSISDLEKKLEELKSSEELDEEKIAECEADITRLNEQKSAYEANEAVVKINSSEDYKSLVALYIELYNKYN